MGPPMRRRGFAFRSHHLCPQTEDTSLSRGTQERETIALVQALNNNQVIQGRCRWLPGKGVCIFLLPRTRLNRQVLGHWTARDPRLDLGACHSVHALQSLTRTLEGSSSRAL